VPEEIAAATTKLCIEVLGGLGEKEFYWKLENQRSVCLVACFDGEQMVGFKLGYGRNRVKFYSWLGGVAEPWRRKGVAKKLMDMQHDWCREHGFQIVETQTLNQWKEMLIFNLREGFEIVGVCHSDDMGLKVVLEKRLDQ
jgi:GNAT superfamily N-acetyltransferase